MLKAVFGTDFPIIGVVHLPPLPGSPKWSGDWQDLSFKAVQDAHTLDQGGVNGIIIENYSDTPFVKDCADAITVSTMSVIARRIRQVSDLPLGINVLRNDALSALAIAAATEAAFVRVNVLTGAMLTDQGIIEGKARELHLAQRLWQTKIPIFADVLVKHATPLGTPDLAQTAKDTAYRALAAALIISGSGTGEGTSTDDLKAAKEAVPDRPIFVGSGTTLENVESLIPHCDGLIVASTLKEDGRVKLSKVKEFVAAVRTLRN